MTILDARKTDPYHGGKTFSLKNRLYRGLWEIVWMTLGIWTPRPLISWRRFLLRLFGAKLHPTAVINAGVRVWSPQNLEMAEYSCLGPGVICYSMAPISLGPYALVSQRAHLCAGTHDITDSYFQLQAFPIHIGEKAWVAAEAFVGPGVTIGARTVLGARGVTFKSLPPDEVYAGNPARFIKPRHIVS